MNGFPRSSWGHVHVPHRGRDVRVPHEFLDHSGWDAGHSQPRAERMAQPVDRASCLKARVTSPFHSDWLTPRRRAVGSTAAVTPTAGALPHPLEQRQPLPEPLHRDALFVEQPRDALDIDEAGIEPREARPRRAAGVPADAPLPIDGPRLGGLSGFRGGPRPGAEARRGLCAVEHAVADRPGCEGEGSDGVERRHSRKGARSVREKPTK